MERKSTIMESMGQMVPMEGTNEERLVGPTCEREVLPVDTGHSRGPSYGH